jgi:uncharacterized protein YrrD
MDVRLGAPVFGVAGKSVGHVSGLVVNAGTKRATAILIDSGLLDREQHIVGVSAIQRADADGLHLDQTAQSVDNDSTDFDAEEIALPQRVAPPTEFIPAAGVGGPVAADEPTLPGRFPDDSSFFEMAPIDPPPIEIFSNLGENEVRLDKGTDVLSSDGHKVGEAEAFSLGDMGLVEQIAVSEGFLGRRQASFPLQNIAEFGTNKVHLRLSKEAAEAG